MPKLLPTEILNMRQDQVKSIGARLNEDVRGTATQNRDAVPAACLKLGKNVQLLDVIARKRLRNNEGYSITWRETS